jgi:hypothetical protein
VDVGKWIMVQQDQVRDLPGFEGSALVRLAHEARWVTGCRLECRHWRKPGLDEQREFIMQTEPREAVGIHRVRACEDANARSMHLADEFQISRFSG